MEYQLMDVGRHELEEQTLEDTLQSHCESMSQLIDKHCRQVPLLYDIQANVSNDKGDKFHPSRFITTGLQVERQQLLDTRAEIYANIMGRTRYLERYKRFRSVAAASHRTLILISIGIISTDLRKEQAEYMNPSAANGGGQGDEMSRAKEATRNQELLTKFETVEQYLRAMTFTNDDGSPVTEQDVEEFAT